MSPFGLVIPLLTTLFLYYLYRAGEPMLRRGTVFYLLLMGTHGLIVLAFTWLRLDQPISRIMAVYFLLILVPTVLYLLGGCIILSAPSVQTFLDYQRTCRSCASGPP